MLGNSVTTREPESTAPARRTQIVLARLRDRLKGFALKDRQGELVGEIQDLQLDSDSPQKYFNLVVSQPDPHKGSRRFLLHSQQLERIDIPGRSLVTKLNEAEIRRLTDYKLANPLEQSSETVLMSTSEQMSESTPYFLSQPASTSMSDPIPEPAPEPTPKLDSQLIFDSIQLMRSFNQPEEDTGAIVPDVKALEQVSVPLLEAGAEPLPASEPLAAQAIRLLEERLIVNRSKRKAGEIVVRKVVETRMVEVPVRREKLIVEQVGSETRQLAEVDISSGEITGVELNGVSSSLSHPTVKGEFASLKTTSQLLEAIAKTVRHRCKQVNVELLIEDRGIQKTNHQFPSPRIASQVLAALAQTLAHRCQQVNVELVVADSQIQKAYQDWFERYRDR